jgi:hypothetical protein
LSFNYIFRCSFIVILVTTLLGCDYIDRVTSHRLVKVFTFRTKGAPLANGVSSFDKFTKNMNAQLVAQAQEAGKDSVLQLQKDKAAVAEKGIGDQIGLVDLEMFTINSEKELMDVYNQKILGGQPAVLPKIDFGENFLILVAHPSETESQRDVGGILMNLPSPLIYTDKLTIRPSMDDTLYMDFESGLVLGSIGVTELINLSTTKWEVNLFAIPKKDYKKFVLSFDGKEYQGAIKPSLRLSH